MHVCYLTNGFPFPLTSGYLRHFHLVRELARDHEVTLLSLAGRGYRPEHAAALAPYTRQTMAFPTQRTSSVLRPLTRRLRVEPAVRQMARTAARLNAETPFDAVVVSGKATAPVLDALPGVPVVADLCDATTLRLRGQIEHADPLRRAVLRWDAWRVGRVETRLAATAARLVVASARDRDALLGPAAANDPRVAVIPNGIDLEFWDRGATPLGRDRIVMTGAMHSPPSEDAALVLVEALLPRVRASVPEAEAVIVGRDPTPRLLQAGRAADGVTVTGYVDDVRPYMASAAVAAAPLRFGAGIQNKVLEAMAFEVPVVASTVAAGGLRVDGATEPPIEIADDPDVVAGCLVDRLLAARRDATPDRAARAYVTEHFSWRRGGERLSRLIDEAARTREGHPAASRRAAAGSDR